jgi:RNA polymerase-binding transcription factor DksA
MVAAHEPLTPEQSRRVLEAHLARTERELAERQAAAAPGGERPGFGKRAGDYVAQVVDDRTNNQLADALAATAEAIRQALALLDEGSYGRCRTCGGPITADRLGAVPWAQLCMGCQADSDRGRRRPLGRPQRP